MSICTQRVLTTANALGVQVEVVVIDLFKHQQKSPEFVKMQPFGRIPVLEDDGFFLYESRAIARYLCLKHESAAAKLYPADIKQRALVEQFISVESSYYKSAEFLLAEAVFKKFRGQTPDDALVAKHKQELEDTMVVYDRILEGKTYLVGDSLTLADIFHIPCAQHIVDMGNESIFVHPDRPNVARWWKAISTHEAWVKVISK